jgi:ABC-type transport system involved in cytochrome c biogenesis permease subunit
MFRPRVKDARGMDLEAFGELPVLYEGRVKPLDSLARNALRVVSNYETFKDAAGDRQPAIRWLADVIADPKTALNHRVMKIENLELLQTLGLQRRKGYLYAINEFNDRIGEFTKQVDLAGEAASQDKASLSTYQRKVLELDRRLKQYLLLVLSFQTLPLPDEIPTEEALRTNREEALQNVALIGHLLQEGSKRASELEAMNPPRAIPSQKDWVPVSTAYTEAYRARMLNMISPDGEQVPVNEGGLAFRDMLKAYGDKNAAQFNRELRRFEKILAASNPDMYHVKKIRFEAFYNHLAPFFYPQLTYILAFVLSALAWLGWSRPLNRAAFWLVAVTFAVHTFALVARIYISGRPPVTNLYSSAIFIGWAAVAAGMGLEILYRIGIGNIVAAVGGFATLIIASYLATSGETMTALEAVLDTQFWLATHVVCITLGYSATFVAGLLGLLYVLGGVLSKSFSSENGRDLAREIYGTLCFALIFSFIGTVLGGLWADDSWGRFWGWDPKENGALIIVLWNALVLHARWDGMIRDRGLAVLAVGGNITTSWSWFGVNELGIGLHSYGFTEGVLFALVVFAVTQLIVIGIGCMPKRLWRSELGEPAW